MSRLLCTGICFVLLFTTTATSQISISPTTVFIHENPGISEIYLTNSSNVAQEISFDLRFGYPSSNDQGEIIMAYNDSLKQQQYGLSDYLRLYPSRVIIPANQSQTIRVQILPMQDRQDGVYWSRLIVAASAVTPDIESQNSEGITTNINYVLEQNIPLFYRKGDNTTGVNILDVDARVDSSQQLIVIPELERTGNSPYLGRMHAKLYTESGDFIEEKIAPAYFYFKDWRKFTFQKPNNFNGPFRLDLEFETYRQSINSRDIVKADKISHSVELLN